jgi:hypothetical protein
MTDEHYRWRRVLFLAQSAVVFHLSGDDKEASNALDTAVKIKAQLEGTVEVINHELSEAKAMLSSISSSPKPTNTELGNDIERSSPGGTLSRAGVAKE